MSERRSPEEIAAERMLADPDAIRRRLDADIAEVARLGQGEVSIDPAAPRDVLMAEIRSQARRIGFDSPIAAATAAMRHIRELPVAERGSGSPITPYHEAAHRTLAEGELVAETTSPTGERLLVLQRVAEEAAGVTVTLRARVRIDPDHGTWLDSFGWPVDAPDVPVYSFTAGPAACLSQALADLRDDTVPFDRAMLMVLGTATGTPEAADERQRRDLALQFAGRPDDLDAYIARLRSYADDASGDGWFGACLYRSALETLFEGFLGGAAFALVDMSVIDDIDEDLREQLPLATGASPAAAPVGIPAHHWWWTASGER
ncbi:hypothetical protein SAMN02745673_02471 [Marinactinospora thermotolerans DSM 45154]|uniref:Uncharacterized protein n=1 Tax=Marinactinospora thermotolerans DSM 45154 TaxID=1122192 RepID=A0A1T4R3H5_9ACTN|nr:hypothetical protein [Marinactinospora thermotolerans]SKA10407.1 hypothetical protein SAMN02745673_02471 [Marinactinospora thermotolerans DSM 45154]